MFVVGCGSGQEDAKDRVAAAQAHHKQADAPQHKRQQLSPQAQKDLQDVQELRDAIEEIKLLLKNNADKAKALAHELGEINSRIEVIGFDVSGIGELGKISDALEAEFDHLTKEKGLEAARQLRRDILLGNPVPENFKKLTEASSNLRRERGELERTAKTLTYQLSEALTRDKELMQRAEEKAARLTVIQQRSNAH